MNHIHKLRDSKLHIIIVCITLIIGVSFYQRPCIVDHFEPSLRFVVVTPAGRRQYLEILYTYLHKQKHTFSEWHLWMNTNVQDDITYMHGLAASHTWIKLVRYPQLDPTKGSYNVIKFLDYAEDFNTIYLKLDDDIVWLEDEFISKMYQQRVLYPQYFLVYANTINNAIITHLHQRSGAFPYTDTFVDYDAMGKGWTDVDIATRLHRAFIGDIKAGSLDKWRRSFSTWIALNFERISINAISWYGRDMSRVDRTGKDDDEQYLSVEYPKMMNRHNVIVGQPMCVHYAFYTQREHLDTTNVLAMYRALAGL